VWRARFVVARGTLAVACVFVVGNANTQRTRFCIHFNTQRAFCLFTTGPSPVSRENATAPQSTIHHDWSITSVLGRTGDNPPARHTGAITIHRLGHMTHATPHAPVLPPSPPHLNVAPSHAHTGGGRQLSSRAGRGRLYMGTLIPTQRAGARCGAHWGGARTKGCGVFPRSSWSSEARRTRQHGGAAPRCLGARWRAPGLLRHDWPCQ